MGLEALAFGAIAGGQIMGGISAEQQGAASQRMSEYNAKLDELKAKEITAATTIKQNRQADEANRYASSQEAALGASGAVTTTGAPLLMQAKQASESELENVMIGYEGVVKSDEALSQAKIDRMQGKMAKAQGTSEMYSDFMKAGGTLLMGFAAAPAENALPTSSGFMRAGTMGTSGGLAAPGGAASWAIP